MKTLLCIMNGRNIREAIDSYNSLTGCDLAWMTGFYIKDLVPVHREIVESTDYDAYIMVSDDCVVTQKALDAVKSDLEKGHPVVTGWGSLIKGHIMVNLCREPLRGNVPVSRAFTFWKRHQVLRQVDPCPTHFVGMSLTGMPRGMWQTFPYDCYTIRHNRGHSSDFHLSVRLRDAEVPMVAPHDAWVDHLKPHMMAWKGEGEHRLLVGEIEQEVTIVREPGKNKMGITGHGEDEFSSPPKATEDDIKPYHKGGGYYDMPDGRTIKGKRAARKALDMWEEKQNR